MNYYVVYTYPTGKMAPFGIIDYTPDPQDEEAPIVCCGPFATRGAAGKAMSAEVRMWVEEQKHVLKKEYYVVPSTVHPTVWGVITNINGVPHGYISGPYTDMVDAMQAIPEEHLWGGELA